ncbi:putative polyketide biosynthesis enoyl-CoA hydratase PksH [Candidatus Rubidus massiliensis]|nr:MAG: hypothetical protein BGO10_00965 [Chlamydia sp. 32-24]CDZ81509.1 putative polyketide biosynthesis enoyl-CoA hydratase PksH [Candidatus Rubidus massiliensis]
MIVKIKDVCCFAIDISTETNSAISLNKLETIFQNLSQAEKHQDVKCILIKGNKEIFCAGFDLSSTLSNIETSEISTIFLKKFLTLLKRLSTSSKPIISVVEGKVMGGGVGIVAASDVVIANQQASFSLPETIMGILPGVVFPFIANRIGVAKTKYLALGGVLNAEQAYTQGLVDELNETTDLPLKRIVYRLSLLEPNAIKEMKRLSDKYFTITNTYFEDVYQTMQNLFLKDSVKLRISNFYEGLSPWDK